MFSVPLHLSSFFIGLTRLAVACNAIGRFAVCNSPLSLIKLSGMYVVDGVWGLELP